MNAIDVFDCSAIHRDFTKNHLTVITRKTDIASTPGESLNQISHLMEEMMANHKFERQFRDAEKSFPTSQSESPDIYKAGIDLFTKGIERNVEVQKHLLEVVSQQNAEAVDLCRTMFENFPLMEPMFNLAEHTVENLIELRRSYLEIVAGKSREIADSAKTAGEETVRAAHEMTMTTTQRERRKAA
jgi:hypothetical protein